tara:strand:+ start:55 stop:450 length:396 start_codon:yes stop_codon:yes gene_type:complete
MTQHEVSLDTLVTHLLASKRSLASISTVWRANEIVTSARSALEQSAVLSARTGFLRSGISEQVKILRRVRGGIENVYKEGQRDFKVGLTQIRREVRLIMIECYTDTRFGKRKAGIDDGYSAIHNGGSCVQT